MSPYFKLTMAVILGIALVLLSGCANGVAKRSVPYSGKGLPHCEGVWVTNDHRTWHCYSHREFQNWRKRNGV